LSRRRATTIPVLLALAVFAPLSAGAQSDQAPAASPEPWPVENGTEIGGFGRPDGLDRDFEPSGAVWHPRLEQLLVVDDEGRLARLDGQGKVVDVVTIGGDLEGIAIADPESSLVYLGIEHPDGIAEMDLDTGRLTGRRWGLTDYLKGRKKCGLEGLTFAQERFFAGHQCEAKIYVFDLLEGGRVVHVDTLEPEDETDLSGLHWDPVTKTLYTLYDSLELMVERDASGRPLRRYTLPFASAEGVASIAHCPGDTATLFIAADDGGVWRYDDFPADCPHLLWGPKGIGLAVLAFIVLFLIARLHSLRRQQGATAVGPVSD
jgi:hypothetical protein